MLIESVREYSLLYDPKEKYYYDSIRKENTWGKVSRNTGIAGKYYPFICLDIIKKIENDDQFYIIEYLMRIAGIWRSRIKNEKNQTMYSFYSIFIQICYNSCIASFIIKLIQIWGDENEKAIEGLSMLTICIMISTKIALFQLKDVTQLISNARKQNKEDLKCQDVETKNILLKHSKYANILNIFIVIYGFSLGGHLIIAGLFEYQDFHTKHKNDSELLDKPLQVVYWYPFNPNKYYVLVQIYQAFTILFSDLYNAATQTLFIALMIHVAAQLKILQHNFRTVTKENTNDKYVPVQKLKRLIKKHQTIISYTSELNNVMKFPLLLEYIMISLLIAAILVQILSGKRIIFNIQYALIISFQLFVLAWNANEIQIQSFNLSSAIYECGWYNQSPEFKRLIRFTIIRAQKPMSLNIGTFGPMTADAALSRIKLAYTYVSLMSGK